MNPAEIFLVVMCIVFGMISCIIPISIYITRYRSRQFHPFRQSLIDNDNIEFIGDINSSEPGASRKPSENRTDYSDVNNLYENHYISTDNGYGNGNNNNSIYGENIETQNNEYRNRLNSNGERNGSINNTGINGEIDIYLSMSMESVQKRNDSIIAKEYSMNQHDIKMLTRGDINVNEFHTDK